MVPYDDALILVHYVDNVTNFTLTSPLSSNSVFSRITYILRYSACLMRANAVVG